MRSMIRTLELLGASAGLLAGAGMAAAQGSTPNSKLDDPTIVAIFDAANTWDIESAGLGAERTKNADVARLARMFVRDHESVRQQGRDLAHALGVTPTPPKDFPLAQDHQTAMAKLHGLHGAAFDRAFLDNEVAYHKAVIDAINSTLLPATQNAELKALVVKVAPAFQAHMMAAQQLRDKLPS